MIKINNGPLILLLLNIFLILSFVSIFFITENRIKKTEQIELSEQSEVLGTSTTNNVNYSSVTICVEHNCFSVSEQDISTLYENKILNTQLVNGYVTDKIIPYFEKFYGSRTIVSNNNGSFYTWINDKHLDIEKIEKDLFKTLSERDAGASINSLSFFLADLPGTDGTFASKYIEIDNSKQKLYVWNEGKTVKEILLSGPKYGFQVYGVYSIIDKGSEPQAPSGRYMPYWMAFYYSKSQDSWYGLHGLVWWYDSNGKRILESEGNIGIRRSSGCIRMLKEDAKYLYENFNKGDSILIHE